MQKRLECKIFGRVQLVMYRDFARREARQLGLAGFAKNAGDGSVEIVAEGEEEKLETFLESLKRGPVLARVERINSSFSEPSGQFTDFDIIYDSR